MVNVLFFPTGPNGEKVGADDYLLAHGPASLADLFTTAWPFDPALNDHEAEIYWHLRGVSPESSTFDKLTALAPLAPILAKMAHLEAAAMLEGLKDRFKLRAKDLNGLTADVKVARKAHANKDGGTSPALNDLEKIAASTPPLTFQATS